MYIFTLIPIKFDSWKRNGGQNSIERTHGQLVYLSYMLKRILIDFTILPYQGAMSQNEMK